MALEPAMVTNYEQWGKLVKTWATGDDYVQNGKAYERPTTLPRLIEQMNDAGVGPVIPSRITSIQLVQVDMNTLVIKLPPREMIKAAEAHLQTGGAYRFPQFYSRVFNSVPTVPPGDGMKVHAERIGDYTITLCQ